MDCRAQFDDVMTMSFSEIKRVVIVEMSAGNCVELTDGIGDATVAAAAAAAVGHCE
jgi:hypothetical protein